MTNVIKTLKERGFIESMSSEELTTLVEKPAKIYCGFDPTGESLHLGNLVAIMGLAWFQKFGHTPVAVVGGATGMIGDPSGKSSERVLLDEVTIHKNLQGIRKNLETILRNPKILNNYDWFKNISCIDYLREIGKYFRIGPMLGKESVKTRLNSEEGMSYTEFSYQVLQGYDFLYLYEHEKVSIQIGGSDQWGNITAGIDLIRKIKGETAYGITFPLLTKSDGQKFGKSEKGAVWLSAEKLSPYEFYQYLYRTPDADVIRLMKMLTFLPMEEIQLYEQKMKEKDYEANFVQKKLAAEITKMVHGENGLNTALKVTAAAAPGTTTVLDSEILELIAQDMPSQTFEKHKILNAKLIDLLVESGLQTSKGNARKLISNGGLSLNNKKIMDQEKKIHEEDLIEGKLLLITIGKTNKSLIKCI